MKIETALYLTDVLGSASVIFSIVGILGAVLMLVAFLGNIFCAEEYIDRRGEYSKIWNSVLKKWWVVALSLVICVFIPSKKTMYMMLGSSYLKESNLPSKVSRALELKLDDYIEELSVTKKKDKE